MTTNRARLTPRSADGVAGIELDDLGVDHGGEQDVLGVVVVARQLLDIAAREVGRRGRGRAARGKAIGLQAARLLHRRIEVDADEAIVGVERGDVGAFVKIDEGVGAAGEDGLEPGRAQDGVEPVGGVERVGFLIAEPAAGTVVGTAVARVDDDTANGVTARDFGRAQDRLEELDCVHARDEPVVVAALDGKTQDVMNAVEVHVAGAELEADRVPLRIAGDEAVVAGGNRIAKAIEQAERMERDVLTAIRGGGFPVKCPHRQGKNKTDKRQGNT